MRRFEAVEEQRFSVTAEGRGHRAVVLGKLVRLPETGEVARVLNEVRNVVPQIERASFHEHLAATHERRLRAALRVDDVTWCSSHHGLRIAIDSTWSISDRLLIAVRSGKAEYGLWLNGESFAWLSMACGADERGVEPSVALACTITRMLLG